jgi:hypothetical protein
MGFTESCVIHITLKPIVSSFTPQVLSIPQENCGGDAVTGELQKLLEDQR